ncbi:MAG: class I SAM-dependent methyltransferase [Candidatus Brocadia sp.]|nr:MAG: class I SAM-dependent methyltransferase [Candidatus Brocadia sp.]
MVKIIPKNSFYPVVIFLSLSTLIFFCINPVASLLFADTQDKMFWNKKYGTEAYIFGKEPVEFLREHIDILSKGKALDIAMGEGRNAVFLAKHGFEVDGCDISEAAIKKARELARENSVTIHAFVADLETYQLPTDTYDVIACFYYLQRDLVPQMKAALKPGGVIIYETYTIENWERGFEGPKNKDYLLQSNELLNLFKDLKILYYRELILNNKKAIASLIAKK